MPSLLSRKWTVLITSVIVTLTLSFFLFQLTSAQRPPTVNQPLEALTLTPVPAAPVIPVVGLPIRLKIPSLNIDAPIEQVGLTASGAMGVPSTISTVAWYDPGPRPGEIGSAVIDGHFGWKRGIPSVFENLHKLKPGDTLSTIDDAGLITFFTVRKLQTYTSHEPAPDVFVSTDDSAHLNLITCQGVWSTAKQSYNQRLVVFSDKISA